VTIGTPRRAAARLAVVATTAAVGLSACTGVNTPPEPFPPPGDGRSASVDVPRVSDRDAAGGLATVALEHLDPVQVAGVSAGGVRGHLSVSIWSDAPGLSSLFVSVSAEQGLREAGCGLDDSVEVVSCEVDEDSIAELAVDRPGGCSGPALTGRFERAGRGNVLVQLFGRDTSDNRRLVLDLLDDPRLGLEVPDEAVAAGQELDVDEQLLEAELVVVDEDFEPPC
jgi:hypothetical protein